MSHYNYTAIDHCSLSVKVLLFWNFFCQLSRLIQFGYCVVGR